MVLSADFLSLNNNFYKFKTQKKIKDKNAVISHKKATMPNYSYYPNIYFSGKFQGLNNERLKTLNIPNLQFIENNSLRGESLAHKRNIHYLPKIKEYGIKQIIDLKTSDFSNRFQSIVESNGLSYLHFPIDSGKTSSREIIEKLPEFFDAINNGNFYIACAQGLHRTDIALSINYLFNKDADFRKPPVLYGHRREKGLRCDDIFRRCNGIFLNLTSDDREKLGLTDYSHEDYQKRKRMLISFNTNK